MFNELQKSILISILVVGRDTVDPAGLSLLLSRLNLTHWCVTFLLSPEQIVQCDRTSFGCGGEWTESAYKYVQNTGGLELDSDLLQRCNWKLRFNICI